MPRSRVATGFVSVALPLLFVALTNGCGTPIMSDGSADATGADRIAPTDGPTVDAVSPTDVADVAMDGERVDGPPALDAMADVVSPGPDVVDAGSDHVDVVVGVDTAADTGADAGACARSIVPASVCPADDYVAETAGIISPLVPAPCGSGDVIITTGTPNIQAAIMAAPTGARICFAAGRYRLGGALSPRIGQTLRGEPGAILDGSMPITTPWTASGGAFVSHVVLPRAPVVFTSGPACEDITNNPCRFAEDVYCDGVPLRRVTSVATVTGGTFFVVYPATGSTIDVYVNSPAACTRLEIATTPQAIVAASANVTVETLLIEKFATRADNGTVQTGANTGFVIHDCEVRYNHGTGVQLFGDGGIVRNNNLHHNGQLGAGASGVAGARFEHNVLAFNNADAFWRVDGAAGGVKLGQTTASFVRFNSVHDNVNRGIWIDVLAANTLIEGNDVRDNFSTGIEYEISSSPVIRHNTVFNNGLLDQTGRGHAGCVGVNCSAGIVLNNVDHGCVYANVVSGNQNPIALIQIFRASMPTAPSVHDVYVFDNAITATNSTGNGEQTGLYYRVDPVNPVPDSYAIAQHNVFFRNSYHLPSLAGAWLYWAGAPQTRIPWTGTFSQDACGTFASP